MRINLSMNGVVADGGRGMREATVTEFNIFCRSTKKYSKSWRVHVRVTRCVPVR